MTRTDFNFFVAGLCAMAAFVNALHGSAWLVLLNSSLAALNIFVALRARLPQAALDALGGE